MSSEPDRFVERSRFRLPVSGRLVALGQPSGLEDLLLLEAPRGAGPDAIVSLALATRLMRIFDGTSMDWSGLAVPDLDVFVTRLRQAVLGDRIRADLACPAAGCARRIDIDFGVEQYLTHHAQSIGTEPDGVCHAAEEPGWFRLLEDNAGAANVRFRLPTVADQVSTAGRPEAADELARRCLTPVNVSGPVRDKVEAAMELLAPSLASDLQGVCPECSSTVAVHFDARWYCLQELRQRAAFIYHDVDLLARRYHWSEAEILALPNARRHAYAELARPSGGI